MSGKIRDYYNEAMSVIITNPIYYALASAIDLIL